MPRRLVIIVLALLCFAPTAQAKIKLDVEIGWEEKFRAGKWTPLFLTLQESSPRQVIVEVYCPTDRRYALNVAQGLTISPQPVTIPIYIPLSYRTDETTITIRDANSGRRLESLILSDYPVYSNRGGPKQVEPNALFVLISGGSGSERMLQGQLRHQNVEAAITPPARLPLTPAGYDGIDLVLLNRPEIDRLNAEQQSALADWVRAGGLLVINPGTAPVPAIGPIAEILPARPGPTKQIDLDPAVVKKVGLPGRFTKLTGRELLDATPGARPVPLFGPSAPQSLRRWVGMGQVMILPADVSSLLFDEPEKAIRFWRDALKGFVPIDINTDPNNRGGFYNWYGMTDSPVRAAAVRQALDWIGDVPGAGSFGFSYVAIVLLAMMFIVGPVDWFVLKWTNRQPWTWVTISGWIGLVTLGSIYIGHVFKSGEVYFRTASVIDESAGARVASLDFAGIYSPQTTQYDVEFDPHGWWRTSGTTNMWQGPGNMLVEVPCHQDYRGNRPLPMLINVWNVRFLEGQVLGDAPAFVQAQLSGSQRRIRGSITNRAPFALRDVLVRTREGVGKVIDELGPGATAAVDVVLKSDSSLAATTQVSQQDQWSMYSQEFPTTRPTPQTLNGVSDRRTLRIDQQLADRDDAACIYATCDAAPDERVKLTEHQDAKQAHTGVIRALVTVSKQ